jgi:hypothetical protein
MASVDSCGLVINGESVDSCGLVINGESVDSCGLVINGENVDSRGFGIFASQGLRSTPLLPALGRLNRNFGSSLY